MSSGPQGSDVEGSERQVAPDQPADGERSAPSTLARNETNVLDKVRKKAETWIAEIDAIVPPLTTEEA